MRFSKRPQPLVLDSLDAPAPPESGQTDAAESTAFRNLDPKPADQALATSPNQPPAQRSDHVSSPSLIALTTERAPAGWPIWLAALVVAGLWALAPIAFALGYRSQIAPLGDPRFAILVFAFLAIGPAVLVFVAAYALRQGQKLAFEARRAKAMTDDMLGPAVVAAARAGDVAKAVRDEIALASVAAEEARDALLALREALADQTAHLSEAATGSVRSAKDLAGVLGQERLELGGLVEALDTQASRVVDGVAAHAKLVTDAAGAADTQIREAQTLLSARTSELAAAAGDLSGATRTVGEDLTRHIARLETAGVGVSDQVRAVEAGLSDQRAALQTLSQVLRADHGSFSADAEAHAAKLAAFIDQARSSATEMSARASAGGDSLRALMSDALLQFRDLAETARAEREEFGQSTLQSLEAVSAAAAGQRAELEAQTRTAIEALATASESTREAAAKHAQAAREQVERLSEAAFNAGQQANKVFEARLEEARTLVEQSGLMVEEAGAVTAQKLSEGAAAARETLTELGQMLEVLDERARQLPAAARGQAAQVRAAVADGIDELMIQARRTAEEAQAIDMAFQDRVRRNFEMLSEAVKLMGAAAAPALLPVAAPPLGSRAVNSTVQSPPSADELGPPPEPEPEPEAPGAALALQLGLRQRLRLTPTATDQEFSQIFAAAGGPSAALATSPDEARDGEGWTWKDLLTSIDQTDRDGASLGDELAKELLEMGVDGEKLLPSARVLEIAAAVQAGDMDGARQVVRRLAPAATRRIGRRLFTDDAIRQRTDAYLKRYRALTLDAAGRDPSGRMVGDMLSDPAGRTFLLLDAAAGDLI